ncbi:hypothetical protein SDC9_164534 [bioreactor metagenome]|uniref:Uncharacterized protein n=1 Tax=bioreactor metagenome TaxID=1076179 RepID=A0A645FZ85_9ZZZZ
MALDSNALLPLQVHGVQDLIVHIPSGDGLGCFQKSVGKRAFTVIDMGYNTKVPNMLHFMSGGVNVRVQR